MHSSSLAFQALLHYLLCGDLAIALDICALTMMYMEQDFLAITMFIPD